jgi:hypothetical protein
MPSSGSISRLGQQLFLGGIMAASMASPAFALESQGAEFLLFPNNARTAALAEGLDAVSDYSNPAAGVLIPGGKITALYDRWLEEINHEFLSYNQSFSGLGVLGVNATFLHMEMPGYDSAGTATSDFAVYNLGVGASFAGNLTKDIAAGASVTYVQQRIEQENSAGLAFSGGVLWHVADLYLGASVLNLGPKLKFIEEEYSLPLVLDLGACYNLGAATVGVNCKYQPNQQYASFGLGGEYWPVEFLGLRAGYTLKPENARNAVVGLAAGAGFRLGPYQLDYCYVPYADLGQSHRISIDIQFGRPEPNRTARVAP